MSPRRQVSCCTVRPAYSLTSLLMQAGLVMTWDAATPAGAMQASKQASGLGFAVVTTDSLPKDVIVGRIFQGRA